ncbi:MAG: oligosaccharide flippase family protein [Phycisphaerae bacterium]|nr:oligosaccharide flippase family protein [Phycisphaerae bacterium]
MPADTDQMIPLNARDLAAEPVRGLLPRFKSLLLSQKRNLQNLSALVVFNFLAAGLFFVTQVKIANVIGREQFGLLAYGIAFGMYGQTIVRYGMDRTLVRDLIHYPERFSELVVASLVLRGILLTLVVAVLFAWKLIWQPADLPWPVIAVIVAYSLKSLDLQPVYDAWHCMARHAIYNAIQRGLYFMLIWTVVLAGAKYLSLAWIAFALLATEVLYLVLQQRWAQRRITLSWNSLVWESLTKDLLGSNFWVWLAAVGLLSFGTLSQIFLKKYCGPRELGGYAAGWQIVGAVMLLLMQIARIGKPAMARVTRESIYHAQQKWFLFKYCAVMVGTVLPICLMLWLVPDVILRICFTSEYAGSANLLRVFGVYLLLFAVGVVASQYVIVVRMEKVYLACVLAGSVVGIGLYVKLIPSYHAMGAALALVGSHILAMVLYWIAAISRVAHLKTSSMPEIELVTLGKGNKT